MSMVSEGDGERLPWKNTGGGGERDRGGDLRGGDSMRRGRGEMVRAGLGETGFKCGVEGILGGVDGEIIVAAEVTMLLVLLVSKILRAGCRGGLVPLFGILSLRRGMYETGSGSYPSRMWSPCNWPATAARGL